ncbi:TPA: hypothetical protein EYP84_05705, partial [Candidatus Bipolaricaulota bacterium]|nr:hypothetical protein [Candidatus Bipolaricaulota bacterium]
MKLPSALKFLLPGIGVKRWLFLTLISVAVIAFGVVCLLGKEGMRELYVLVFDRWPGLTRPAVGALVLLLGALGVGLGLFKAVRSVLYAVSPGGGGSLGEALYQARVLKSAPRVVALGGGTGLSTLLRALKPYTANLTAVVTVMDTGGSSGRLREELAVLPPGDVRNCLLALAEDEFYQAMDWLLSRQQRIEAGLARQHLSEGTLALYDLTTLHFEGRTCPLAAMGASNNGPKGKLQIRVGLLCTP